MLNFLRFVLLFCITVWMGMLIFFTFLAAPSIFKVLPRELAADLVANIFPKYWLVGYISGILSLIALLVISFIEKVFPAGRLFLISLMTAITFYSGLVVGMKAGEVRAEMKQARDPQTTAALKEDFKRLHFRSAALNISVILLGAGYIYLTARTLRP